MIYDNNDLLRAMREAFIEGFVVAECAKLTGIQSVEAAADKFIEKIKQRLLNTTQQ